MNPGYAVPALVLLLAGCAGLQPSLPESSNIYLLDAQPATRTARPKQDLALSISAPRARPGFDTAQMVYLRRPHELEFFVKNRWADTPSRMLAPLLAQALEQAAIYRVVVPNPGLIPADRRLDTELIRLQQDFSEKPSRARLTLRAQLLDVREKRLLAAREFDTVESAPSDDAYGGAVAANRALQRLLEQLVDFCADPFM